MLRMVFKGEPKYVDFILCLNMFEFYVIPKLGSVIYERAQRYTMLKITLQSHS